MALQESLRLLHMKILNIDRIKVAPLYDLMPLHWSKIKDNDINIVYQKKENNQTQAP